MQWRCFTLLFLLAAALVCAAQTLDPVAQIRYSYVLGPEDQVNIRVLNADEIDGKPVPVDSEGFIRLPLVGKIRAGGLSIDQLEAELVKQLKTYLQDPQVAISVTEFRSQPVSVIGSVKNPGVHQVQGRKTLLEMLSMAGGIDAEAGHNIKITRRKEYGSIPLSSAVADPSGNYIVADVDLTSLLDASNPQENIEVRPYDVITVPRGELIYVMGQVRRPGGFVLRQRENMSALQALSLAEGLDQAASPQNARILRTVVGAPQRTEIYVDLRKILQGKSSDVQLQPNDVLFIPNSVPKRAVIRGLEAALQVGTGLAIYRR
jgi:polysaccharide export outer membrane protein